MNQMLRIWSLVTVLFLATSAEAVVRVDDTLRLLKAQEVINDLGFYDAIEVEKRARLHLLDQPFPDVDADWYASGTCGSTLCVPLFEPPFYPSPVAQKIQGRLISTGVYLPNFRLKMKASVGDYDAELVGFLMRVVHNGSYDDYRFPATRKAKGELTVNQFLRVKNLTPGDYLIHLALEYDFNGVVYTSPYDSFDAFTVVALDDEVSSIVDQPLKACVQGAPNNYADNQIIRLIEKLDCTNSGLTDASLAELKEKFIGLRYLNLSNNSQLMTLGSLINMVQLSWLDLSDNPQLNSTSAWSAGDLDSIVLSNNNQTTINSVPWNASFIDLSGNDVSDGFTELFRTNRGEAIAALNLSGNQNLLSTSATALVDHMTGQHIDAIDLSHTDITDINDLVGVVGLKHVNLNNATQLNDTQDITNFSGFCGFSMNNTTVNQFRGTYKPIQFLSMTNNPNLDRIQALNQDPDNPITYWPMRVDLTGSNALKCGNYYNFVDATTAPGAWPLLTDMSVTGNDPQTMPQCPTVNWTGVFNHADYCKPNRFPPALFEVYENGSNTRHYVEWQENLMDDYARWGVTHLKITSYVGEEVQHEYYKHLDEHRSLIVDGSQGDMPDKYEIVACNDYQCGYGGAVQTPPFLQGVAEPILHQLEEDRVIWTHIDPAGVEHLFKIKMYYDRTVWDTDKGQPDRFEVYSTFPQSNGSFLIDTVIPTIDSGPIFISAKPSWTTIELNRKNVLGTAFYIKACRDDLGCSEWYL
jgi:hypothetical protein